MTQSTVFADTGHLRSASTQYLQAASAIEQVGRALMGHLPELPSDIHWEVVSGLSGSARVASTLGAELAADAKVSANTAQLFELSQSERFWFDALAQLDAAGALASAVLGVPLSTALVGVAEVFELVASRVGPQIQTSRSTWAPETERRESPGSEATGSVSSEARRATDWAKGVLGRAQTQSPAYTYMEWRPDGSGHLVQEPGQCLYFVQEAYGVRLDPQVPGGNTAPDALRRYNPIKLWEALDPDSRHPMPADPSQVPAGALIFFGAATYANGVKNDDGHIAISLGNGKMIHANFGRPGTVREDPIPGPVLNPIGWAPAPPSWKEAARPVP